MDAEHILLCDRRHLWHPYASLRNPPPVFAAARAHGMAIELADGTELLDGIANWWSAAHGHGNPEITAAMRRQAEKMPHVMFGGFTHEPAAALAERLAEFLPGGMANAFLADSGSIAVEVAAKMAVQYQTAKGRPGRTRLLALKGGYHGDTAGAMALSDPDGMHTLFRGLMPHHFFAEKPRSPFGGGWIEGDAASAAEILDRHDGEIAGVFCEPVFQAANAMWFYHPQYLRELRTLCSARDIPLVFDEIAAGFYRTGTLWAHDRSGIRPDIMCIGKALSGGHVTLGATAASDAVADAISAGHPAAFMHGPTYMANPIACAAAEASLSLFAKGGTAAKVAAIESAFKASIARSGAGKLENIRATRVLGAVAVLEVEALPSQQDIARTILETGVWLRPFGNWIYSIPPLIATAADIDRIVEAMTALAALPPAPPPADPGFHE